MTLAVRCANGPKQITVEQVTRLECTREYPWGRSACINAIRFASSPPNAPFRLEIEMQSGDVLVICGSDMRVEP